MSHRLNEKEFQKLSSYIQSELGIRMPPAKRIMLESRLQKRLRTTGFQTFTEYIDFVFSPEGHDTELVHMIDAVTTNKTDFFREPAHFDYLLQVLLPEKVEQEGWGKRNPIRVWSTASSTGEEPYTLAMVFQLFSETRSEIKFHITATDISSRVLEHALQGIYTTERAAPIPEEYKKRYILRSRDRDRQLVRLRPEIRSKVSFHRMNLMQAFSFSKQFQIVFCRNMIIYFERPDQLKLLRNLFHQLTPGGYLFLGHSETLTGMEIDLHSVAPTIYQKPF
ncbi:MAG: chemotaxis protein CheR [Spirochaetales bacterium]|nr:chemotaxis protein CheR [Spirochaetales bacterium]MCF7938006.1 chemotaxis protein CheR [Spirochaetales bacterium]